MLLRGSIAVLAFAMSALTQTPVAHADEAYVCEAGRVVYVKPGELEAMKQSDACIASYYGITLAPNAVAPVAGPVKSPQLELKKLDGPEQQANSGKPAMTRIAYASGTAEIHHRAAPVAAADTDFRNVRLINGGAESGGWFRHNQ